MQDESVHLILGICLVVIIIFGFVGNAVSFLVWTKGKRCKNCPGTVYLRFLAIADIIVLLIPALELTVYLLEPTIYLRDLNSVFCKIFPICPYFCVQMSTWIVVCLTMEQTVAICRPFQSIASCRKWRQYGLVVLIIAISFLDNIPVFLSFNWDLKYTYHSKAVNDSRNNSSDTRNIENENTETTLQSSDRLEEDDILSYSDYFCKGMPLSSEHVFIVQLGVIAVIPIITLSVCNIIIISKLFRRDKSLARTGSKTYGQTRNTLLASMTARTVAISFVQCVTSFPIVTMDIYFLFHQASSTTSMVYIVCNTIYYLNNAINVIFYCLLGRSFRQDCVDLFTRKPKYGVRSGVATIETFTSSVM